MSVNWRRSLWIILPFWARSSWTMNVRFLAPLLLAAYSRVVVIDTSFSANIGSSFDVNDVSFLMSNAPSQKGPSTSSTPSFTAMDSFSIDTAPIQIDPLPSFDAVPSYGDIEEPWDEAESDADRETNASIQNIVEKLNESYAGL